MDKELSRGADAVDKELSLQNAPHVIGGYEVHCEDAKPKNDSRPTYNYYDWGDSMWDNGAGAPGGGGAPWALAGPKGVALRDLLASLFCKSSNVHDWIPRRRPRHPKREGGHARGHHHVRHDIPRAHVLS